MSTKDLESQLESWFEGPLPSEPAALHGAATRVVTGQPRVSDRHTRFWGWGGHGFLLVAAAIAAIAVGATAVISSTPPSAAGPASDTGRFYAIDQRSGVGWDTSTLLQDGTVLLTRGGHDAGASVATYNPTSKHFEDLTTSIPGSPNRPTATLLKDGRVLFAGGRDAIGQAVATAAIYDPQDRQFRAVGAMSTGRAEHSATPMADGRVLIAGGRTGSSVSGKGVGSPTVLDTAEIFDLSTGLFSGTAKMTTPRADAAAVAISGNRVLIVGGAGTQQLASAEIFDSASASFVPTSSMHAGRQGPTATVLEDGRVLVAGGWSIDGSLSSAELYDPRGGQFDLTGSMAMPRFQHTATRLTNGRVVLIGGLCAGGSDGCPEGSLASSELYDPRTGSFIQGGSLVAARHSHLSLLLPSGDVFIVGGQNATGMIPTAELLHP
jgi:hypothetical protein